MRILITNTSCYHLPTQKMSKRRKRLLEIWIRKGQKLFREEQIRTLITGISKVNSSTEKEISAVLNGQIMSINGNKLSVSKLDVDSGILEAEGEIHQIKFGGKKQKENFFKRVFG